MSILWDAPLTAAVARELRERLTGSRLRAVRMDRESRDLVLYFRESTLVFRLHPLHGDIALLDARDPAPGSVSLKARVREIQAPPDERLLMLQLQPPAGGSSPEGIVVELMTNQWNAVWLTVGDERIRKVLWKRSLEDRTLAPGEAYEPPTPSDRRGIDEPLTEDEWLELLAPVEPNKRRGTLLRSVAFTSSLNARALLGSPEEALVPGYRLWRRIRGVSLGLEPVEPCVLRTEKRWEPYPLPLPNVEHDTAGSLLEAFAHAVDEEPDESPPDAALVPSSLLDRLDDAVARAETKADRLREELADTPDPERIRSLGDLILARFSEVSRGSETVTLEGFDGEPVEVELDPALSAAENADRYYSEAARIERARQRLPKLIEQAEGRARELLRLQERAKRGELSPETLEEELPEEVRGRREGRGGSRGSGRPRRAGRGGSGGGSGREGRGLPYRRYRSSGGLEIRVGRGARANDDLTFHHSSPDDVWLHARQVAGAHVILRWQDDGNPPARDLAQAASLAALHSDARHATSVPVDWTRRKYVRSPRKSPPGVVVPDRVKTVFVDPDPALERRLRET